MSAAVAAILEGMPEPRDLRMHEHDGRCVITAGSVVLFDVAGDIATRNIALAALRQLGFRGLGGRRGAGADGELCRDAVERGQAGRVSGAGQAGPPGRAREGDGGAVGAGQGMGETTGVSDARSGGGSAWRIPRSAAAWGHAAAVLALHTGEAGWCRGAPVHRD